MRLALAVLVTSVVAAPASAQSPVAVTFTDRRTTPFTTAGATFDTQCTSPTVAAGGRDGGPFLPVVACPSSIPQLNVTFSAPQALVELFVRVQGTAALRIRACGQSFCDRDEITRVQLNPPPSDRTPVQLAAPAGATTHHVILDAGPGKIDVDDVSFSTTTAQPDTQIVSGPPFVLASNHPLGGSFLCDLDGGAASACASPFAPSGLAPDAHSLRRGADASDNCPAVAHAGQADADADGVGDACELLPPGNVPPAATPPRTSAPSGSRLRSGPAVRDQETRAKKGVPKKTAIATDIGLLSSHVRHHRPLRRHAHRGGPRPRHARGQGVQETVVVRAGRAYLAKAKLFRVRKGKRPER